LKLLCVEQFYRLTNNHKNLLPGKHQHRTPNGWLNFQDRNNKLEMIIELLSSISSSGHEKKSATSNTKASSAMLHEGAE